MTYLFGEKECKKVKIKKYIAQTEISYPINITNWRDTHLQCKKHMNNGNTQQILL